jgi:hypothetical protein
MKGDFTRERFYRGKDFCRVLLQQGRVQLDADWNEQVAILLHRIQTLAKDAIGPFGGPLNRCGFTIFPGDPGQYGVGAGRYYVNGMLCENRKGCTRPAPKPAAGSADGTRRYILCLDVWESYVSGLQDPSILEAALGGLDTAGRSRVSWRINALEVRGDLPPPEQLYEQWPQYDGEKTVDDDRRGRLRARAGTGTGPGFSGAQNSLYRVEIHDGGSASTQGVPSATFKWSRDNGSIAYAILGIHSTGVALGRRPRDTRSAIAAGDWVEIEDDGDIEDPPNARQLFAVTAVNDATASVWLDPEPQYVVDPEVHPVLRRWDQRAIGRSDLAASRGCVPLVEDTWISLEDGIDVYFPSPDAGGHPNVYRGGDYWTIPARASNGRIEWVDDESGEPEARVPDGVDHHYAPLAGIAVDAGVVKRLQDYRVKFRHLLGAP